MTEREEVAIKLQRLIAAYKTFKDMRKDYPSIDRGLLTAAITAEIDRNVAEIRAEIRRAGERMKKLVAACDAPSAGRSKLVVQDSHPNLDNDHPEIFKECRHPEATTSRSLEG